MTLTEITLLDPDGSHGKLEPREPHFETREQPVTHGYRWVDEPDHGMFMSVWDSTPAP